MDKTELEQAFDTVNDSQTANLLGAEDEVMTFLDAIADRVANYPAPANDPVRQMLNRLLMSAQGFKAFEIANLKNAFGLNTEVPPMVTPTV